MRRNSGPWHRSSDGPKNTDQVGLHDEHTSTSADNTVASDPLGLLSPATLTTSMSSRASQTAVKTVSTKVLAWATSLSPLLTIAEPLRIIGLDTNRRLLIVPPQMMIAKER